jgi:hypothetical protein
VVGRPCGHLRADRRPHPSEPVEPVEPVELVELVETRVLDEGYAGG